MRSCKSLPSLRNIKVVLARSASFFRQSCSTALLQKCKETLSISFLQYWYWVSFGTEQCITLKDCGKSGILIVHRYMSLSFVPLLGNGVKSIEYKGCSILGLPLSCGEAIMAEALNCVHNHPMRGCHVFAIGVYTSENHTKTNQLYFSIN